MKKTYILTLLFLTVFLNFFGQNLKKDNNYNQTKALHNVLVSIKEKVYENELQASKTLDSLKPILEEKANDSLLGLFYRLKYNLSSNQLKKELALQSINKSIFHYNKANNYKGIVLSTMNKGNIYLFKGDNIKAIENYLTALKIAENNDLKNEIGLLNKNIGVVFSNQEKHDEALKYANKALNIFKSLNNEKEISSSYINIGNCYFNTYDANNALFNYEKAVSISEKLKDSLNLSLLYNNIGTVYLEDKKDTLNGIKYLQRSLAVKENLNDKNNLLFQYTNISSLLANLKRFQEANMYLDKAFKMAKQSENKLELAEIYEVYSKIYEGKKDYAESLKYYKLHKKINDTLLGIGNKKAVEEIKTKYETAKKEKQIIEKELKLKKQENLIISLSVFGVLISLIGFLIYRQQKLKNKQQEKEFQLQSAIEKIETQNQLFDQRLAISRDLHDNIGAQLTFIISSVDNLKFGFKITDQKISNQLNKINSFAKTTITELRDTIWAMNAESFTFEDLQVRMLNFKEQAEQSNQNLKIDFTVQPILKTVKISSLEGVNIYRVMQEALNNAVKYAAATHINIHAKEEKKCIKILISDNGKGFNIDEVDLGNGIQNMQKRIGDINGEFELTSSKNGTKILLSIPFKP
ncbi:tetratricopeptide repeat protein [Mariniflexile jejuense]|uniref:histidine kinase n=1 Tax=Mariniflexile jejuense TaxID=1173582 RepID=A0ABW3JGW6_9FLAO